MVMLSGLAWSTGRNCLNYMKEKLDGFEGKGHQLRDMEHRKREIAFAKKKTKWLLTGVSITRIERETKRNKQVHLKMSFHGRGHSRVQCRASEWRRNRRRRRQCQKSRPCLGKLCNMEPQCSFQKPRCYSLSVKLPRTERKSLEEC